MHLGAMQRLHVGGTPFIGAKTHWGPGLQVTTFAVMQRAGFTLRGFRLSHLVLNMIAFSIFFATMLFSFGWVLGSLAILFVFVGVNNAHRQLRIRMGLACSLDRACASRVAIPVDL